MISVEEADSIIASQEISYPASACPLANAQGRILRETVVADRDQPPFHRVAMDGIAFVHDSWLAGQREFPVAGIQRAGAPATSLTDPEACLEVMTGSVLPDGANVVVRYEDVTIDDGMAKVNVNDVSCMQNVHQQGSDRRQGSTLLAPGARLRSPQIAILASVGAASVSVDQQPKIAVISTGDELVDVDAEVEPHQIRQSNGYGIAAALHGHGYDKVAREHLADVPEELAATIATLLAENDLLILSGGVSMGKFDHVPSILADLGVSSCFHKVKQRPGKPLWYGVKENKQVFGLPGNPVSALVCFHRYVLPQLARAAGDTHAIQEFATLTQAVDFRKPFTYFLPVQLSYSPAGEHLAIPRPTNGSGDYGSLAETDGFVELQATRDHFPAGMLVPLFRW